MKPVRDFVYWYLRKKRMAAVPVNQVSTFSSALQRLKKRDINLGTIIDVGASNGSWTGAMLPYYPDARYLCIEALPAHQPALHAFVAAHPQTEYVMCAAGEKEGEIGFEATGDLFGGFVGNSGSPRTHITVPVATIDSLVASRKLPPPYLIKLDTHGYELPILDGARQTLEKTEVLIVEVYNFPGGPPAVSFYEFCRLMAAQGFRCMDLFDPHLRPHDQALWQMDLIFLRDTRPEFQYTGYT